MMALAETAIVCFLQSHSTTTCTINQHFPVVHGLKMILCRAMLPILVTRAFTFELVHHVTIFLDY